MNLHQAQATATICSEIQKRGSGRSKMSPLVLDSVFKSPSRHRRGASFRFRDGIKQRKGEASEEMIVKVGVWVKFGPFGPSKHDATDCSRRKRVGNYLWGKAVTWHPLVSILV